MPLPGVSGGSIIWLSIRRGNGCLSRRSATTPSKCWMPQAAHLKSLGGFHEPQGIAFVSEAGAVAVANGDTGTLQLVDAESFAARWTIKIGGDADNVRYDAMAKRVYVAAVGGLYAVDPATGKGRAVAIDGHPESFQLEPQDACVCQSAGTSQLADRGRRSKDDGRGSKWQTQGAAATIRWPSTNRRRHCSSAAGGPQARHGRYASG